MRPRILLPLLAALLFIDVALAAPAKVTARRLPIRTLRELAARPDPAPIVRDKRHDERKTAGSVLLPVAPGRPFPWAENPTRPAPRVTRTFVGDTSAALWPGDASGAAGPLHVVTSTNAGVKVHARNGETVLQLSQNQFWQGENPADYYYDPRLAYDAAANRWVAVALREGRDLMIGVSATGDPAGTWFRYRLIIVQIDYTRLALTRDTIVTSTRLNAGESQSFYSIDKSHVYAGPVELVFRQYDGVDVAAVPVDAPASPVEYLVRGAPDAFLVNRLDRLQQPWVELKMPHKSLAQFAPPAPQAGTAVRLDTGYDDVYAAAMRGSTIYAARVVVLEGPTGLRTSVAWAQFDPESGTGLRYGIVDDPAGRRFYAYPSLAVSRAGNMLLAYATFSDSQYASAEYLYVDANGNVSAPAVIRRGDGPISGTERWGDYTTTVVDPVNDRDFWTIQLYATSTNTWAAVWAHVPVPTAKRRGVRK